MIPRLKVELRRGYYFYQRLKKQGYRSGQIIFLHLPGVVFKRSYAKIVEKINGKLIVPFINRFILNRFHTQHAVLLGKHFYLIVMPGVLHFIVPCLDLIPKKIPLILLFNGTKNWEINYLQNRYPELPCVQLISMPGSSLKHGDVLTLLFHTNSQNFGVFDHDLYIFDRGVFDQLELTETECMRGIFLEQSEKTGLIYPHTCFLFFNTEKIRALMARYNINANLYKKAPAVLEKKLPRIGLGRDIFIKDYHNFFDTLHMLLAAAYLENLQVGFIKQSANANIIHVGGTSMGEVISKDLSEIYVRLRFLEFINDPLLTHRYASLYQRYTSAAQIIPIIAKTEPVLHLLNTIELLMQQLESSRRLSENSDQSKGQPD